MPSVKLSTYFCLDSAEEEEVALGADAAQCAKYTSSPSKTDLEHPYAPYSHDPNDPCQTDPKHLFPTYSDEGDIRYSANGHLDTKEPSPPLGGPSPKGSPAQRKKSGAKGRKKGGGGTNVPDTNGSSSPNVRRKSRPKSAPKRSPPGASDQHQQLQNQIVVDDYTTPDDYQLDDYSEEEIKLPEDAYTDDYEEDDERQSSDTGGSLSPARVKGEKGGTTLTAPNAQRHKGGKERRKKRKDDSKVTWDD